MKSDPAPILKWLEVDNEAERDQICQIFDASADKLRASGLTASVDLEKGNPKELLVDEAES